MSRPLREPHHPIVPNAISRLDADLPEVEVLALAESAAATAQLLGFEPAEPELVSSADGAIKRMLLTVPGYVVETDGLVGEGANPMAVAYRDLLEQLPDGVALVVLAHRSASAEVRRWLEETGLTDSATLIEADEFVGFSNWAEDGYVALRDRGATTLMEPAYFPRRGDALVADYVSAGSDLTKGQAPLYFQGGNVLVGDDFFFIGIDYPLKTLRDGIVKPDPGQAPGDLLQDLYRRFFDRERAPSFIGATVPVPAAAAREFELDGETWTELLYRGNAPGTRQPLFHIDMFISLAGRGEDGRYRVLVGDPRAAAELLGEELLPEAMAPVFDNIARQLEGEFEVIRNPLPLVYADFPDERTRLWYFATANNALVHRPADGPAVALLPSYGHGSLERLAATDAANREIWEGLGFEVRMLADFNPFALNLGAVHCIKKYLERG